LGRHPNLWVSILKFQVEQRSTDVIIQKFEQGIRTGYRKQAQKVKEDQIVSHKDDLNRMLQDAGGNQDGIKNAVVVYLNRIAQVQNLFDHDLIQNLLIGDAIIPEEEQAHAALVQGPGPVADQVPVEVLLANIPELHDDPEQELEDQGF